MGKKILCVDDAAFMRKMVKDTLSKAGYTDLYEAVDGADAVEKFGEISPDLVIMDITRRAWLWTRCAPAPRTSSLSPLSPTGSFPPWARFWAVPDSSVG